jgi:hypothetical protein
MLYKTQAVKYYLVEDNIITKYYKYKNVKPGFSKKCTKKNII